MFGKAQSALVLIPSRCPSVEVCTRYPEITSLCPTNRKENRLQPPLLHAAGVPIATIRSEMGRRYAAAAATATLYPCSYCSSW